ncbi:uncharacterized protein LOC124943704 [Impatiens glandulifera]|uniref:uncharacterized protein LOC124943704 n=1 Tax=Impatiens glandulifera TaxID=253017 RepID=UPI001FB1545A|nr:uncharacterized protein LOC124943704 [Impatiens glandulifera]
MYNAEAFSHFASLLGKPLYMDTITEEREHITYARINIEEHPKSTLPAKMTVIDRRVTLITWQFIYYVSGTTKSSRGLKHQDTVQTIVQTIEGDDVIDCVYINNQLASNHRPIDDNTKDLEMERSSYPVEIKMESTSNGEISQGWQKYGKCPEGTVPIRRSTNSITRKHPSPHFNSSLFVGIDGQVHEHAIVKSFGRLFGASATFTVWKPEVEHNEFSLAQIWISSGDDENMNTIEVGWIVSPRRYGDDQPRLFTFWTRDGYNTTGCYDHDCAGFVQIDFSIQLGQPIFPSTLGGQLTFLTIMVYKDDGEDGHWWLDVNGILIGYFPKNLFTSLSEYADRVDFGGEILNNENEGHHTTTQMGNGLYAHENGTSTVSEIKVYDQYRNPVEELHEVFMTANPCYGALVFGNSIFYGGPGYSTICP